MVLEPAHGARLQQGHAESAAMLSIRQKVLREQKQITDCVLMVACPIMTETGDSPETWLRQTVA